MDILVIILLMHWRYVCSSNWWWLLIIVAGKHGYIWMIRRLTTHLLDVKYEKPCLHCVFLHLWCQIQTSWCYQTRIILRHALSVNRFRHSSECLSSIK
jgi:hypothetical protein